MNHSSIDCLKAKLWRSSDLLSCVDQIINSAECQIDQCFGTHKNPETGSITVFCSHEVEYPIEVSIICGEVVHQLRSCLDHLVWSMVLKAGNVPARNNQFPISKLSKTFMNDSKNMLKGVPAVAQAKIEKIQPYNSKTPEENYLGILNELSNTDKHRNLNIIAAVHVGFETVSVKGKMPQGVNIKGTNRALMKRNAEILVFTPRSRDAEMNPSFQPIISAAFENVVGIDILPVVPVLGNIGIFIDNFIDEMTPYIS